MKSIEPYIREELYINKFILPTPDIEAVWNLGGYLWWNLCENLLWVIRGHLQEIL